MCYDGLYDEQGLYVCLCLNRIVSTAYITLYNNALRTSFYITVLALCASFYITVLALCTSFYILMSGWVDITVHCTSSKPFIKSYGT